MEATVYIPPDQLNRLFPFHILLNKDLKVTSLGRSLRKILRTEPNSNFSELFEITRPEIEKADYASLHELLGVLVLIRSHQKRKLLLRGEFDLLEGSPATLVFLGTPWFSSIEEVVEQGLTLHDFAAHDATIDLLHVIKSHQISADEEKKMLRLLNEQKRMMRESSKAKENFLANMSHEIRTPLNAIIGMVRELSKEMVSERQSTYLKYARSASEHLLSIVNNILDISKIEADEFQLENNPFSLATVVKEAEEILRPAAQEKMIGLHTDVTDDIAPALIGDASRLRQVLLNIISNSIKFTEEGSIWVRCSSAGKTETEQMVNITITDTGVGMDPSYLKAIFRKFSQEDLSTARRYGGSGLGLAITNGLIKLMKGEIDVVSEKGKGTVFHIQLKFPIIDDRSLNPKLTESNGESVTNFRLLLVEDNELNRLVAYNTLSQYNFQISVATNGLDAVEMIKYSSYDLILMDVQMPVMDGVMATKLIRNTLRVDTPIIALTAHAFKHEIERCMASGMNGYVTKPYEEKVLLNVINSHLPVPTRRKSHNKLQDAKLTISRASKSYDLTSLKALSDDEDFIHKIVEYFIQDTPLVIKKMRTAFDNRDWDIVKTLAHGIKPGVMNLGLVGIKDEIAALSTGDFDAENGDVKIRTIEQGIGLVVAELQKDILNS